MQWISIHASGIAPVYTGAFYRSQKKKKKKKKKKTDADYVCLLERSIETIPKSASVWILGDFNFPDIDWEKCFQTRWPISIPK